MADLRGSGSRTRRGVIPRSHFTHIADRDEVDARTVERDYVLSHMLAAIAAQPESRRLAFKGGTALRLCYLDDYRYSADLDFSLLDGMSVDEALAVVRLAMAELAETVGFPHLAVTEAGTRIEYVGPL